MVDAGHLWGKHHLAILVYQLLLGAAFFGVFEKVRQALVLQAQKIGLRVLCGNVDLHKRRWVPLQMFTFFLLHVFVGVIVIYIAACSHLCFIDCVVRVLVDKRMDLGLQLAEI